MRNFNHIFLLFFFFLLMFSCKKDSIEDNILQDSLKVEIKDVNNIKDDGQKKDVNPNADVRFIRDTQVIFFLPSPKERQDLIKFYGMYDQYIFRDIFSNFIDLSNTAKTVLRYRKIPVEVTYAKRFVFPLDSDTLVYDLNLEDQILGYILADGQNLPLIKNGVTKRNQLSNDLRNYFNLINFSISE